MRRTVAGIDRFIAVVAGVGLIAGGATAICGALHGIEAFPEEHIQRIKQANSIDFAPYAQRLAGYRFA